MISVSDGCSSAAIEISTQESGIKGGRFSLPQVYLDLSLLMIPVFLLDDLSKQRQHL